MLPLTQHEANDFFVKADTNLSAKSFDPYFASYFRQVYKAYF